MTNKSINRNNDNLLLVVGMAGLFIGLIFGFNIGKSDLFTYPKIATEDVDRAYQFGYSGGCYDGCEDLLSGINLSRNIELTKQNPCIAVLDKCRNKN